MKAMDGESGSVLGDSYDAEQLSMMDEMCILVDEQDNAIGSASKVDCHLGSRSEEHTSELQSPE